MTEPAETEPDVVLPSGDVIAFGDLVELEGEQHYECVPESQPGESE